MVSYLITVVAEYAIGHYRRRVPVVHPAAGVAGEGAVDNRRR